VLPFRGYVSNSHAHVQVWVNALSTTSDTNVSKKRVDGKILLQDDDLIEIGQRQFIFHSLFPIEKAPGSAMVSFHTHYAISTHHPAH